jgi:hypothetical protein
MQGKPVFIPIVFLYKKKVHKFFIEKFTAAVAELVLSEGSKYGLDDYLEIKY